MQRFLHAFDTLPNGSFSGEAHGRRYLVCKTAYAHGAAQKLVAEALDGSDYISLNLYRTGKGALLRPCEMPEAKVIDFVLDLEPTP